MVTSISPVLDNTTDLHTPEVRVLFVIDQLKTPFGGAEEILRETTRLLPNYGVRCAVVTFAADAEGPGMFDCPVKVMPMTSVFNLNAIRMATRFVRHMWRERPHVVHTMFESSDLWAGTISKLTWKAAVVSSRRDMGIQRNRMHDAAYRLLRRIPDRVITVSEQVRRFVIEADGIAPDRVTTIYNGVNDVTPSRSRFEIRQQLGIPADCPVVVTVGNVRRVKGFDVLLRAAKLVLARTPNAHFAFVGGVAEPAHMAELNKMIAELGLGPSIHFVGHQTDVASYLAASDVFVLPSRSEGFSNALLQAMAAGLPCVATRVGGNSEAIEDGISGYIVEPENVESLAERICLLSTEPALASEIGTSARRRSREEFSTEAMMRRLINVYRKSVRSHR